ncbi:ribosomal protein-like protein S3, partial [Mycena amicta]
KVSDVFRAELNEFFTRELTGEGYSGCDVRVTHTHTEIIIHATHTQEVLGEKGHRVSQAQCPYHQVFLVPR